MRLTYLAPVPWNSFSQRAHELVRYFHLRTGEKVVWIDPYPTRLPSLVDILNRRPKLNSLGCPIPAWLTVIKPLALPIEPLPFSGTINSLGWKHIISAIKGQVNSSTLLGIGKPSALALQLLTENIFTSSFYDAMDDFSEFYRGWSRLSMARQERRVVRMVTTVLAASTALGERLKREANNVCVVLNGCAAERLPDISQLPLKKRHTSPVIGYIGTIAGWFDWELVLALAKACPQAIFRLIGPLYVRPPPSLPKNVFLEPPLSHPEALKTLAEFDIGLIPFKKTTLTSAVDPIKYYEYRALGLPVVSSTFGEMVFREQVDGVYLVNEYSDIEKVIKQALAHKTALSYVEQFRRDNSWETRFDQAKLLAMWLR